MYRGYFKTHKRATARFLFRKEARNIQLHTIDVAEKIPCRSRAGGNP